MASEATVTSGAFTYTTAGLLRNGIPRADLLTLHTTLHPPRTRKPSTTTAKWFSAQLGHYGLPTTGTKATLEARLRAAHKEGLCKHQPEALRLLEERMRAEWQHLHAKILTEEHAREEKAQAEQKKKDLVLYRKAKTDDERLAIDGGVLWLEEFEKSGERTGVLKSINHCPIWGNTEIYHLAAERALQTWGWNMLGEPEHIKWIVVGYDRNEAIARSGEEILLYMPTSKKLLKAQKDAEDAAKKAVRDKEDELMKAQPAKWNSTHILGTWKVTCPAIQEGWSDTGELSMTLVRDSSDQIVGKLQLGIIEGVLRLKGKPTAAKPSVEIYWAGRETGEGDIVTDEDGNRKGKIEFSGKGAKAKLVFGEISLIGNNVKATAVKVSQKPVRGGVDFDQFGDKSYEDQWEGESGGEWDRGL